MPPPRRRRAPAARRRGRTRRGCPSRRRTAVSHRLRSGQSDPNRGRNAAATSSVGTAPAGSAPASITPGRFIQNGRSAARMSSEGDAMRGSPRRRVGPVGMRAGPSPMPARAASSAPSGEIGSPVDRAARSWAREARPQQGADHRARRRPHDHLGVAGVPAGRLGEPVEHAGVVGVADDPAGAEDQPDATGAVVTTRIVGLASGPSRLPSRPHEPHECTTCNFPLKSGPGQTDDSSRATPPLCSVRPGGGDGLRRRRLFRPVGGRPRRR